jgi:hypothetical protein
MCTSLALTYLGHRQAPSVMQGVDRPAATQPAPVPKAPAPPAKPAPPAPVAPQSK